MHGTTLRCGGGRIDSRLWKYHFRGAAGYLQLRCGIGPPNLGTVGCTSGLTPPQFSDGRVEIEDRFFVTSLLWNHIKPD